MRVPEALAAHPLGMCGQLRLGGQARTGVVEVHVAARVEVGILRHPQLVKRRRAPVAGVGGQEAGRLLQGPGHDFPRTVSWNGVRKGHRAGNSEDHHDSPQGSSASLLLVDEMMSRSSF